ncbi:hypothetical protein GGP41_003639 [Bipolaris sorokiniana]|uniref:Cell wall mannoprotein PIR1-like C-terminal domain-containing protein n=2 Tax=Cochliobolus sativus TaxID=45130 RepID=A0A8H5Z9N0_COCSA|nr:uncharacterized protein COCSADRAFT_116253 [Bipolaris sorokiniana ND90Pr]EMD64987.1 hypothetical protein COCSADRAFT_116253 [Bipolaris sorokiniana ND90Pr]KAF5846263.1 hypothetical protein GGP41_003639 [Bipolaris sorokiniana]
MRASALFAPLFLAATALGQAVEEGIAPDATIPDGCEATVDTPFKIGTLENPSLKKRETAQQASDGELYCTLKDGILHDQFGRTGSIVANRQFQFDGPPQAGAIYTGGFSVCKNDSLAIGGSTRWWRCMSGAFGNLYDEWIGAQCHEIRIQAIFDKSSSSSSSDASKTSSASSDASATESSVSGSVTSTANSTTSLTSGASSTFASATSSSDSESSRSSGSAGSSTSPTGSADAPPANGAAPSLLAAPFAVFGVSAVFFGAALML